MNCTKEQLRGMIAQITETHTFGTVTPLSAKGLPTPRHKVRAGHPRVLVNPETLAELRRNLSAEENAAALADYRACLENPHDGTMPPPGGGRALQFFVGAPKRDRGEGVSLSSGRRRAFGL